jgi:hypothetical protein
MGKIRDAYDIFVGRPEGERPLARLKGSWEY